MLNILYFSTMEAYISAVHLCTAMKISFEGIQAKDPNNEVPYSLQILGVNNE